MHSKPLIIAPGTPVSALLNRRPGALHPVAGIDGLDAIDARILICHGLGLSRTQLITQSERMLTEAESREITALLQRRIDGEPIAYIVGEREFYGISFYTTPDVLIPRPETELLVDLALNRLPAGSGNAGEDARIRVLDMGTGSGAIAVALASMRPDICMTALDISDKALEVARRNAQRNNVRIELLRSDWYAAVEGRQFDLIVANPPYIVAGDAHLSQGDLRFEPQDALTDHADGLQALRAIIGGATRHLTSGGWLLVEHGYDQAGAVGSLMAANGLPNPQSWTDLAGIERVTGASH